tara:strand:+ start:2113 stop:2541 length:429 start_codon:yes stop_codon:yes gene_type:complete
MSRPNIATEVPAGTWMRRLQESHWIWLVKQEQYASVNFPWQPPGPGHISGRLCLTKFNAVGDTLYRDNTEVWFVKGDGTGFDGTQLIMPCEGHLPETLADIVDEEAQRLIMTIDRLTRRVEALERQNAVFQRVLEFPFHRQN